MNNGYDEIGFVAVMLVLALCLLGVTLVLEFISEWRDK
jgi:uncharacterized membrane protein